MPNKVQIHIVDDDEAMRDSLAFLLGAEGFATRAFDSATDFLDSLKGGGVACLITDIRMPVINGIDLLRRLKTEGQQFPVIIMTGHGDVPLAVEAMKLGAFDFLEKPFDEGALIETVQSALQHHDKIVRADGQTHDIAERIESLTTRERQVLDGLVAGRSNKAIAHDLAISPRTVEIYRANVMTKMKAASVSDLVRFAVRAGYVS